MVINGYYIIESIHTNIAFLRSKHLATCQAECLRSSMIILYRISSRSTFRCQDSLAGLHSGFSSLKPGSAVDENNAASMAQPLKTWTRVAEPCRDQPRQNADDILRKRRKSEKTSIANSNILNISRSSANADFVQPTVCSQFLSESIYPALNFPSRISPASLAPS